MEDLLVSLPTRNGPYKVARTIRMLYNTCYDRKNFKVVVLICNDQRDMYAEVIKDFPEEVEVQYIENTEKRGDWTNIIKAQHEEMKKGYYFFMLIPDDIYGFNQNWDKYIIEKKGAFKDDLFVLYTQCRQFERNPEVFRTCYTEETTEKRYVGRHSDYPNWVDMFCEQTPIWTYKFGEFIYPLFEPPYNFTNARESLIAQIIRLLYLHGYNRHVESDFYYEGVICDFFDAIEKFPEYHKLKEKKFDLLVELIGKMEIYIESKSKG